MQVVSRQEDGKGEQMFAALMGMLEMLTVMNQAFGAFLKFFGLFVEDWGQAEGGASVLRWIG
jgi:hypothetical protein